jgi:hypothetical protein
MVVKAINYIIGIFDFLDAVIDNNDKNYDY